MYTWSDLKLWLCCLLQRPLPHRSGLQGVCATPRDRPHCKGCAASARWRSRSAHSAPRRAPHPGRMFARGVSAASDTRFSECVCLPMCIGWCDAGGGPDPSLARRARSKEKKLLRTMKFSKELLELKVDLGKVNWTVMRVWVAQRLTELLGLEDEVLIGYVLEQLEGQKVGAARALIARPLGAEAGSAAHLPCAAQVSDPRLLQINLTGFLEKNTSLFVKARPGRVSVRPTARRRARRTGSRSGARAGAVDAAGQRVWQPQRHPAENPGREGGGDAAEKGHGGGDQREPHCWSALFELCLCRSSQFPVTCSARPARALRAVGAHVQQRCRERTGQVRWHPAGAAQAC